MTRKLITIVLAPRSSIFADQDSPDYDMAALSLGLGLAAQSGATTLALTVAGPRQSEDVCQEALALGCERAVCIRSPLPLDYLGCATLLARQLREPLPDLIVCGDHYADHGNAALAGALSSLLDWPLLTGVLAASFEAGGLCVQVRSDLGQEKRLCTGPVVLAALQREPMAKVQRAKRKQKVEEVFADALLDDTTSLRARGEKMASGDFVAHRASVELMSEPAELLSHLLTEKLWKP